MSADLSPVLILGATSDIGLALAREYAKRGAALILAARQPERLDDDLLDLQNRYGVNVRSAALDLLDADGRARFLAELPVVPGTVISVAGLLGEQERSQTDAALAEAVMTTNYVAPSLLLSALANRMLERGAGTIIGVSSVAGDRGRASNYLYGSAKAGFSAFLSGLRARLRPHGIHVLTVKPGFVDTRMTRGLQLPPILTASPTQVAREIVRAHLGRRSVIYTLGRWRWIMLPIRLLPEPLFMRLKF